MGLRTKHKLHRGDGGSGFIPRTQGKGQALGTPSLEHTSEGQLLRLASLEHTAEGVVSLEHTAQGQFLGVASLEHTTQGQDQKSLCLKKMEGEN